MTISEIENIKLDTSSPIQINSVFELENYLIINDYIALKVIRISNSYDSSSPIPITLNGVVKGYLIFTSGKGSIDISTMTEFEFVSFLTIADNTDYSFPEYKFETDFLIVTSDFFLDYISDYQNTSMIWGGFNHENSTVSNPSRYKKSINKIELGNKLRELDSYSYENCVRAIEQPYAFERFLKLYHLLELEFDYFIIKKIKNLKIPDNANEIGIILNNYTNKEIVRLTELIETHCLDIPALEKKLENIQFFQVIGKELFIDFGTSKSDLHLTNLDKFKAVVSSGSFSSSNMDALKVPGKGNHSKLITNITAYWIYRIRCSIAHNKIGEYLLSWNDEDFIVEFGEPLIKEVLMQFYKKI